MNRKQKPVVKANLLISHNTFGITADLFQRKSLAQYLHVLVAI